MPLASEQYYEGNKKKATPMYDKSRKTWSQRLKITKSEKSQPSPEQSSPTPSSSKEFQYSTEYRTSSSQLHQSVLSRSMKYAEPWLYGTVRGIPARPVHGQAIFTPIPDVAVVVCSCPEYLNGTKKEVKKASICKKCKGSRLPLAPIGGTVCLRASGMPPGYIHKSDVSRGGTMRLPTLSSSVKSRPSILDPHNDPYNLMRRSRLLSPDSKIKSPPNSSITSNNLNPLSSGNDKTFRKKDKGTSPTRGRSRNRVMAASPSPEITSTLSSSSSSSATLSPLNIEDNKSPLIHNSSSRNRNTAKNSNSKQQHWLNGLEPDPGGRRSILQCDINPYDLISMSSTKHNNEFSPERDDDIFNTDAISHGNTLHKNKVLGNYKNVKAIAGQRISLGDTTSCKVSPKLSNQKHVEDYEYDNLMNLNGCNTKKGHNSITNRNQELKSRPKLSSFVQEKEKNCKIMEEPLQHSNKVVKGLPLTDLSHPKRPPRKKHEVISNSAHDENECDKTINCFTTTSNENTMNEGTSFCENSNNVKSLNDHHQMTSSVSISPVEIVGNSSQSQQYQHQSQQLGIKSILKRPSSTTSTMSSSSDTDNKNSGDIVTALGTSSSTTKQNESRDKENSDTNFNDKCETKNYDSKSITAKAHNVSYNLPPRKKVQFMVEDKIIHDENGYESHGKNYLPKNTKSDKNYSNIKSSSLRIKNSMNESNEMLIDNVKDVSKEQKSNFGNDNESDNGELTQDKIDENVRRQQQKQQEILEFLQQKTNDLNSTVNTEPDYIGEENSSSEVKKGAPLRTPSLNSTAQKKHCDNNYIIKVETFAETESEVKSEHADDSVHQEESFNNDDSEKTASPSSRKKGHPLRRTHSDRRSNNTTTIVLNFNDTTALRAKGSLRTNCRDLFSSEENNSVNNVEDSSGAEETTAARITTTTELPTISAVTTSDVEALSDKKFNFSFPEGNSILLPLSSTTTCSSVEYEDKRKKEMVAHVSMTNDGELKANNLKEHDYNQTLQKPQDSLTKCLTNNRKISLKSDGIVPIKNDLKNGEDMNIETSIVYKNDSGKKVSKNNTVESNTMKTTNNSDSIKSNLRQERECVLVKDSIKTIKSSRNQEENAHQLKLKQIEECKKKEQLLQNQKRASEGDRLFITQSKFLRDQQPQQKTIVRVAPFINNSVNGLYGNAQNINSNDPIRGDKRNNNNRTQNVKRNEDTKVNSEIHRLKINHRDDVGNEGGSYINSGISTQKKTSILISGDDCYSTVNVNHDDTPIYQSSVVVTDGTRKSPANRINISNKSVNKNNNILNSGDDSGKNCSSKNTITINVSGNSSFSQTGTICQNSNTNPCTFSNRKSIIPIGIPESNESSNIVNGKKSEKQNSIGEKKYNNKSHELRNSSSKRGRTIVNLDAERAPEKSKEIRNSNVSKEEAGECDVTNNNKGSCVSKDIASHDEELFKILRNPVEAVRRNLVPHVCGKRTDTTTESNKNNKTHVDHISSKEKCKMVKEPDNVSEHCIGLKTERNSFIAKLLEDPTLNHLADGLDSEIVVQLIENSLRRLKDNCNSNVNVRCTKDNSDMSKLIDISLSKIQEERLKLSIDHQKGNNSNGFIADSENLQTSSVSTPCPNLASIMSAKRNELSIEEQQESQSNRGSISSGNSYSSANNNYELFEYDMNSNNESDCYQSCSSEITGDDDTNPTRSKFYQMLVDATLSEIESTANAEDSDHHYESIRIGNGDPIYEEINDVPPPLPLSPPPLTTSISNSVVPDEMTMDEKEEIEKRNRIRSIFEGASKYDILSYLVDAKERGLVREESYEYNFSNTSDIIVEEETDKLSDLVNKNQKNLSSIENISSRLSQISGMSDSSDLDTSLTNSINEKQQRPEQQIHHQQRKASSIDIERNDSGVGSETSKSSRSKYQNNINPGTETLTPTAAAALLSIKSSPIHLCEDCDGPVETQITDSGVMYAPLVCRKCGKKRAERKEIIMEIVETEEKYGRDLQIILEEFCHPMLVAGLLTQEQLSAIFLNTEELLENSQALAERMRDALDIALEQGDDDLLTVNIGKIFLESTPMLHAFESYCVRQAAASLLLANLEKEKELLRIFLRVSQMENTVLRRMNLNSFLMVPVQRVTKYPLLLARLHKVTPPHLEGKDILKQAQEKIELHLNHMNQEAKDVPTKLWRRISSSSPNRRASCEIDMINIKLRKMSIDVLEWNPDEVRFAVEGKLLYTQPTDSNWKKARTIKLTPVNALLVTNGKPTSNYKADKTAPDQLHFPKHTGIREAALLLVKEKCGRHTLIREPLYLDRCVVCTDADWDDYFEVHEISTKDTFMFKAEDGVRTKQWYSQLQYHAQGMGAWRKRRNALANIMINGMLSRT